MDGSASCEVLGPQWQWAGHWAHLPDNVTVDILRHLPPGDRRTASATCQRWRQSFHSPVFWRTLRLKLQTKHDSERLRYVIRYAPYVTDVSIEWWQPRRPSPVQVVCDIRNGLLDFLTAYAKNISCVSLKMRCHWEWASSEEKFLNSLREKLREIIKNSKRFKYLSFGCHPGVIPDDMFAELQGKCKLEDLHMATVRKCHSSEVTVRPSIGASGLECPSIWLTFPNLKFLSLDWDFCTSQVLQGLNARSGAEAMKKFTLFIQKHECVVGYHPSRDNWNEFVDHNPKVEVSLVFVGKVVDFCIGCRDIKNITTMKLLECDHVDDVEKWGEITEQLALQNGSSHVSKVLVNLHYDIDTSSAVLWRLIHSSKGLQHFTLIGHYVTDQDLLLIARCLGHLKCLLVTKRHIVTDAEATNHYISISSSKLSKLQATVSEWLGRPWEAVNRVPLQPLYFVDSKDDLYYITGTSDDQCII